MKSEFYDGFHQFKIKFLMFRNCLLSEECKMFDSIVYCSRLSGCTALQPYTVHTQNIW